MEILIQTINGKIFKCPACNAFHIEFKNLNFNLKEEDFWNFVHDISKIDGKYCEGLNAHSNYSRKIIIPISRDKFNVLLNNEELVEFKRLLSFRQNYTPYQKIIKAGEFEFTSNLN
ncbi:MAG: DUF6686 family protein [Draconibacterium sp.]